ncbi:MAG: Gfo/Idh/MocA family protein [Burkholderiales bacterium]
MMKKENAVRLGLSGLGSFALVIANAVQKSETAKLTTCFDPLPQNRKKYSEQFGCDQETSFEALVRRDDIDGVLLVTPNAIHAEQTVIAAERGKHVWVIKPIANTLADAKRMIEACEKAGVVLMIGHPRRRQAATRKAKQLVDEGAIGRPIMVEANASSGQGWELTPDKFRWKGDDSGCPAGSLMTIGVHDVDVFNYIFGPIKSVFSLFNKLYIPAEVEDVTTTVCQFESGILGYLGSNFASPRTDWIYMYGTDANLLWTAPPFDLSFDERMKVPRPLTRLLIFEKGKGEREIPLTPVDPYVEEMEAFSHCIRTGERPETGGQEGLTSLAFIRAAIDSARTRTLVELKY